MGKASREKKERKERAERAERAKNLMPASWNEALVKRMREQGGHNPFRKTISQILKEGQPFRFSGDFVEEEPTWTIVDEGGSWTSEPEPQEEWEEEDVIETLLDSFNHLEYTEGWRVFAARTWFFGIRTTASRLWFVLTAHNNTV